MNKKHIISAFSGLSRIALAFTTAFCLNAAMTACGGDEDEPKPGDKTEQETPDEPTTPDEPGQPDEPAPELPTVPVKIPSMATGADVSWLTELEDKGYKFQNTKGEEMELMTMLRDEYGMNAIRLRVWVNPADGYNNIDDVMKKARRAHALGMALMIDFHFSDTWADPAHQTIPSAWSDLSPVRIANAMKEHVKDMLTAMLKEGMAPAWVQIGNETSQGMLFESGKMSGQNAGEFPRYLNAGYDAVKALSPDTQVIVHLPNGYDTGLYTWFFDLVKKNGGKYDMIGMSLYPETETWPIETEEQKVDDCLKNIAMLKQRYGKDVMICEIGFHYSRGEEAYRVIRKIFDSNVAVEGLKGVFYWEPEAPEHYNGGYDKGCFVNGRPNRALEAFRPTR